MTNTKIPEMNHQMRLSDLPEAVRKLSYDTSRPVIKRECLFFRESRPVFLVPDLQPWGKMGSSFRLDHRLYYLWQADGTVAVYAYLYGGAVASDKSYGCLYVGCVRSEDWTLGGGA